MEPIRILLADDQDLFREGVAELLSSHEDMLVVGEASNGEEAVAKAQALRPDLVLMDVRMPVMDGLEAIRRIHALLPEVKVVMLTVSDAEDDLFEALKEGAVGYLLKNLKARYLFEYLRRVMQDEIALSPYLATRVLQEFTRQRRREEAMAGYQEGLTEREKEVLQLVVDGHSNKEIGLKLGIAESTVKRHLHNILAKLQMANRVQAAGYAVRTGLVEPPNRAARPG